MVLGAACRLSGFAAALLLMRVALVLGLESSLPLAALQIVLALVVAVFIGNIVTEWAFALSETAVTALGFPFLRATMTISGRMVIEISFPGGTWIRREKWRGGAAWEWTERDGSCTRVESPAMTVVRATPLRTLECTSARRPTCHGPDHPSGDAPAGVLRSPTGAQETS
jgi:hypothetical protein